MNCTTCETHSSEQNRIREEGKKQSEPITDMLCCEETMNMLKELNKSFPNMELIKLTGAYAQFLQNHFQTCIERYVQDGRTDNLVVPRPSKERFVECLQPIEEENWCDNPY